MQRHNKGSLAWLSFDNLSSFPEVIHASFLRHGGVSLPPFNTLNFRFKTLNFKMDQGESEENVHKNISIAKEALGVKTLFFMDQTHGKEVVEVTAKDSPDKLPCCDALLTCLKGVGLVVRHADCQAAILYDPIHKAIGAIHAGWRGQVINIYKETVEKMTERFQSRPQDLIVAISPSLGPESAEFLNYKNEFPSSLWKYQVKPFYFDLWKMACDQFCEAGVLARHIEMASLSTASHTEDFFSYRQEKITGRNATVIALKE